MKARGVSQVVRMNAVGTGVSRGRREKEKRIVQKAAKVAKNLENLDIIQGESVDSLADAAGFQEMQPKTYVPGSETCA